MQTFADQAVIAIENVRLFDEVQARTEELSESLQQQTATADVLEVISRSAFDLKAVFEAVAESSVKLCEADKAFIFRFDGELLRMVAAYNSPPEFTAWVAQNPIRPGRHSGSARAALERRTIHIPDVQADPEYSYGAKNVEAIRTILGVPILKADELLGVIMIYRLEVRPFTEKQIDLVETFADQAVIAIENMRLFEEVQARTRELTQSVDELKALGEVGRAISSTLDLNAVLNAILTHACRLADSAAARSTCSTRARRHVRARGRLQHGRGPDRCGARASRPARRYGGRPMRRAARGRADRGSGQGAASSTASICTSRAGMRALLAVPLLHQDKVVGALVVRRKRVGAFAPETVSLLQSFASQSAIAIQNARLFHEIEDKSRQLEIASQHKSQFVANMSHELRTPLAAMLGYAELMQEGIYGVLSEKSTAILARIQSNGKHLLGLINSVLDIAKIEAGQFSLNLCRVCAERHGRDGARGNRVLGRSEEAGAQDGCRQEAAARPRRRAAPHPGAAQSRRQRHQVYRRGRGAHHGAE